MMIASTFVRTEYPCADAFTPTRKILDQLVCDQYLVVQEVGRYRGLLAPSDLLVRPYGLLVDCLVQKPRVPSTCGLKETLEYFSRSASIVLPVFDADEFQGVILKDDIVREILRENAHVSDQIDKIERFDVLRTVTAGIAHDLGNMLMALGARRHVRLALDGENADMAGFPDPDEILGQAGRLTRALVHLCNEVPLQPGHRETSVVIRESVGLYTAGSGVVAEVDCPPDLPFVTLDSSALARVIGNLVLNARDATSESGTIQVRATLNSGSDPVVRVEVEDDGPGIPPEALPKIFELFYTTKPEGSGIGLRAARDLVEKAGGTIEAIAGQFHGATFVLELPVKPDNVSKNDF